MAKRINEIKSRRKYVRLDLRGHLGFPTKIRKKRYDIFGNVDIMLDKKDKDFQKEMKVIMKLPKKLLLTFLIHSKTIDLVYKKFKKEVDDNDIDFAKLCHVLIYYDQSKMCYVGCFDFDLLKEVKKMKR